MEIDTFLEGPQFFDLHSERYYGALVLNPLLSEFLLYVHELTLVVLFQLENLIFKALYLLLHHFQLYLGVLILLLLCLLMLLAIVTVCVRGGTHEGPLLIGCACGECIHLDLPYQLLGLLVILVLPQGPLHIREDLRYQVHYGVRLLPGLVNARLEFLLGLSEQAQELGVFCLQTPDAISMAHGGLGRTGIFHIGHQVLVLRGYRSRGRVLLAEVD